jgi:hypothetical protein
VLTSAHAGGWTVAGAPPVPDADALTEQLYAGWYTRAPAPVARDPGDPPLPRRSLLSALRAAHQAAGMRSEGWTVTRADARGRVWAERDGRARVLRPGEYHTPGRAGVPVAPGEQVEPVGRLDHLDAGRGLWWAVTEVEPASPAGRLYFDVRPATAARAVHEITFALSGIPHQLKCPVRAEACARVDAIVVYHERAARTDAIEALLRRWDRLGPLLDPAVPPLTCPVRPGLSWADDDDPERSYGESRCHMLATAIVACADWGERAPRARVAVLHDGLRDAGVGPAEPWLARR